MLQTHSNVGGAVSGYLHPIPNAEWAIGPCSVGGSWLVEGGAVRGASMIVHERCSPRVCVAEDIRKVVYWTVKVSRRTRTRCRARAAVMRPGLPRVGLKAVSRMAARGLATRSLVTSSCSRVAMTKLTDSRIYVAGFAGTAAAATLLLAADATCDPEPTERVFTAEEVSEHSSMAEGVWVTFGDGVYDVTDFVKHHPGGHHILAAAGGPLEPLWAEWQVHLSSGVMRHLKPMRIGTLDPTDQMRAVFGLGPDPYDSDPPRDAHLRVLGEKPFDSETAYSSLASEYYTPQHLFYVRNHLPVPAAPDETGRETASSYSLRVDLGEGRGARTFTMRELRESLPQAELEATLQCTGNRCNELEPSAAGGIGQIGHARWRGVWLRDLLLSAAASPSSLDSLSGHVHAVGGDGYEVSVPLEKAMGREGDTMIAHTLNGEALSRDHGAPARLVVPGFVGARSVKWLSSLSLQPQQSESVWQRRYYRVFPPWVREIDQIDYDDEKAAPAYAFPVQSAIVTPANGSVVTPERDVSDGVGHGTIRVRGYALSGGGQRVVSVRVSANDGRDWIDAKLEDGSSSGGGGGGSGSESGDKAHTSYGRHWSWVLWEAQVPAPPQTGEVRICCKATDGAYNTQPERADHIYNLRGYMSNAWSRVTVSMAPSPPQPERQ